MRLLRGLHNKGLDSKGCVATIGNFDGVHLGHRAIVERLKDEADVRSLPSVVMIFEPQPLEYFSGDAAPVRLMTFREKYEAIATLGVDFVCCLRFDGKLSQLNGREFINRVLVQHLRVKHLVVGDDFRFGSDRQGDFNLLRECGVEHGFSVENTPTITHKLDVSPRISSTNIRSLLEQARFEDAAGLLGQPYQIVGRVVHGQKLGRTIGFPTANIALNRLKVPISGVYAVELSELGAVETGKSWIGIANIGYKPTLDHKKPSLEVHLLDANPDLYGARVAVRFARKIRDEKKFDGVDQLQQQISEDVAQAREYWLREENR